MREIIKMIYITLISLLSNNYESNEPKRLYKKEEPKKIKWNMEYAQILFIIVIIGVLILSVVLIYKTGSLESTNYYYRLNGA